MATYTDNYQLTKPTYAEQADIGVVNSNMNKIDEVMHSSQISLAPAYDSTQTYAEGDKVMYELLMYKCISPTTGVWDGSKWERTTASESGGGGSAELDILGEASGAIASFADGASAGLAKCIAEIVPKQDLHGYDKPWAGGAGKNKFNADEGSGTESGVTYTNTNGVINAQGTPTADIFMRVGYITPENGVNYILNGCPEGGSNSTYRITLGGYGYDYGNGYSFTGDGQRHAVYCDVKYGLTNTDLTFYPMIRLATVQDDSFEPYSNICRISGSTSVTVTVSDGETSTTKTTALGQMVYGGQLNVLTGELTIDRQIVDLGTLTWTRTDNSIVDVGYWFHANITGKMATGETINSNYRTAPYKSVTQLVNVEGSAVDKVAVEAGGEVGYRIIDSNYTDATAFKTAMNGVQMCYFLASPQTVQLTPQEVNSLLGQNNISADTGDIDIVYVKASAPIQPNPTGTPTATLSKLGIEGTIYGIEGSGGGGGNVYGAFIDTNRVLYSQDGISSVDYTAVEDCYVMLNLESKNTGSAWAYIDGELVGRVYCTQGETLGTVGIYLKRGQRVTTENTGTIGQFVRIYGLTFGTNNIFTPQIYSTEERCVGVWIDNKPLYMRTFDLGSDIQVPYNTFINTTIDAVDKKAIIDAFGIYSTGETFYPLVANINNGIVRLQACRDNQVALVQYVTIKYIKITD